MKKKITINLEWWFTETSTEGDIKPSHQEALEESGTDRVIKMMAEGYIAGELHDNIYMDDDDPEDRIDYSGWWSSTIETL